MPDTAAPSYVVVDGLGGPWLAIDVGHHTCGTVAGGHYGAHEPGCGLEPVAPIEQLLDEAQRLADQGYAAEQITKVLADHRRLRNVRSCSGCGWEATAPGRNGDPDTMHARHQQFNDHLAALIITALTDRPAS